MAVELEANPNLVLVTCKGKTDIDSPTTAQQILTESRPYTEHTASYRIICDLCGRNTKNSATSRSLPAAEQAAREPLEDIIRNCEGRMIIRHPSLP